MSLLEELATYTLLFGILFYSTTAIYHLVLRKCLTTKQDLNKEIPDDFEKED
jgi:hypothetical protein